MARERLGVQGCGIGLGSARGWPRSEAHWGRCLLIRFKATIPRCPAGLLQNRDHGLSSGLATQAATPRAFGRLRGATGASQGGCSRKSAASGPAERPGVPHFGLELPQFCCCCFGDVLSGFPPPQCIPKTVLHLQTGARTAGRQQAVP